MTKKPHFRIINIPMGRIQYSTKMVAVLMYVIRVSLQVLYHLFFCNPSFIHIFWGQKYRFFDIKKKNFYYIRSIFLILKIIRSIPLKTFIELIFFDLKS